jgi:hypothetical protein
MLPPYFKGRLSEEYSQESIVFDNGMVSVVHSEKDVEGAREQWIYITNIKKRFRPILQ